MSSFNLAVLSSRFHGLCVELFFPLREFFNQAIEVSFGFVLNEVTRRTITYSRIQLLFDRSLPFADALQEGRLDIRKLSSFLELADPCVETTRESIELIPEGVAVFMTHWSALLSLPAPLTHFYSQATPRRLLHQYRYSTTVHRGAQDVDRGRSIRRAFISVIHGPPRT